MKISELKSVVKEAVKEAIQEEMKDMDWSKFPL